MLSLLVAFSVKERKEVNEVLHTHRSHDKICHQLLKNKNDGERKERKNVLIFFIQIFVHFLLLE